MKDLPKVPTWRLEWDSNLRPFGRKAPNLPLSNHTPFIQLPLQISTWRHSQCKFSKREQFCDNFTSSSQIQLHLASLVTTLLEFRKKISNSCRLEMYASKTVF